MRAELLPALSAGGADGPAGRYLDLPSGFSMYGAARAIAEASRHAAPGAAQTMTLSVDKPSTTKHENETSKAVASSMYVWVTGMRLAAGYQSSK